MNRRSGANANRGPGARPTIPSGLSRSLPILSQTRRYDRTWFRADLVAGVTVAALVIPKSPSVTDVLSRDGVIPALGEDHVHPDLCGPVADRIPE